MKKPKQITCIYLYIISTNISQHNKKDIAQRNGFLSCPISLTGIIASNFSREGLQQSTLLLQFS